MPVSRTRSRRPERLSTSAWLAVGLLAAAPAGAHGPWLDAIPDAPGLRLGAAVAGAWYAADAPLPMPPRGVLLTGQPDIDRDGARLEHATLDVGWRLSEALGATAAIGWHGDGDSHFEAFWLHGYRATPAGDWTLGAGRRRVPLGPVLDGAGHFDRFGLMPLARRATFDGDWIEEGASLGWRGGPEGVWDADFGLWRGRAFPDGDGRGVFPHLRVGAQLGHVRVDGFIAHARADGRGAEIQRGDAGHGHGVPSCAGGLAQVVCFEGDVDLAGASARWHLHEYALDLSLAGLSRRERGDLYSQSGDTRYHGRTGGGWLEAAWGFRPDWTLAARLEGVRGRHRLSGAGAGLVAREAGLLPDPGTARRAAVLLAWSPRADLTWSAEIGEERDDLARNRFVGLRLHWRGELRQD